MMKQKYVTRDTKRKKMPCIISTQASSQAEILSITVLLHVVLTFEM
jgi:hypothetical protein